jgi:hypothetical protein
LPSTIEFEIETLNTIVEEITCECPAELGDVDVRPVNAHRWVGVFKPYSDLDVNMHRSAIRIHARFDGSVVSTLALPVVVNVTPAVTPTPSTVVFGTIPLEGTRAKTVTLSTADGAPTVLDLTYPGDVGLHAEVMERSNERFVAIRVQQQAGSLGFQKHLITVAAMHLDEVTRFELPVIYHGIVAERASE